MSVTVKPQKGRPRLRMDQSATGKKKKMVQWLAKHELQRMWKEAVVFHCEVGTALWKEAVVSHCAVGTALWKEAVVFHCVVGTALWKEAVVFHCVVGTVLWKEAVVSHCEVGTAVWKEAVLSHCAVGTALWKEAVVFHCEVGTALWKEAVLSHCAVGTALWKEAVMSHYAVATALSPASWEWEIPWQTGIRIACVLAWIQTEYLLNTRQECSYWCHPGRGKICLFPDWSKKWITTIYVEIAITAKSL